MRRKSCRSLRRLTRPRRSRARQENAKPQNRGNPATQRQEAKGRESYARPPARYGVFIQQTRRKAGTQSRVLGNRTLRRLRPMPDTVRRRQRLCSSGCRRYNICFRKPAEKRRRKAMGTKRRYRRMSARPPGIFASARRKGTRFASAAHRA